jgi:hypothetical protein
MIYYPSTLIMSNTDLFDEYKLAWLIVYDKYVDLESANNSRLVCHKFSQALEEYIHKIFCDRENHDIYEKMCNNELLTVEDLGEYSKVSKVYEVGYLAHRRRMGITSPPLVFDMVTEIAYKVYCDQQNHDIYEKLCNDKRLTREDLIIYLEVAEIYRLGYERHRERFKITSPELTFSREIKKLLDVEQNVLEL